MRILVLSKRQYTGKDLLDDAYGRCYELPLELARLGHEVRGVCASYRTRPEGEVLASRDGAQVRWQARNVRPFSPASIYRWAAAVEDAARSFRAELIWACSDSFHAILGARTQRRCGAPCIVDLYDNFESYAASRFPGVRRLFRRAVEQAAGLTCVSRALETHVRRTCGVQRGTMVLENGVGPQFRPLDRLECRKRYGLPERAKIVGTAGALSEERGIDALFTAFRSLEARHPDLHLLLAGPVLGGVRIPEHPRVRYLGERPHAEVPAIFCAMDVAVVCNRRSAFGDYAFPQKLYEIIACRVPPVVADTPGVSPLLAGSPRHRYEPESAASLAQAVEGLLAEPALPAIEPKSWTRLGRDLAAFCEGVRGERRQ